MKKKIDCDKVATLLGGKKQDIHFEFMQNFMFPSTYILTLYSPNVEYYPPSPNSLNPSSRLADF